MRIRLFGLLVGLSLLIGLGAQAASGTARPTPRLTPRFAVMPLRGVSPAALDAEIAAGKTVRTWSSTITSGLGGNYTYRMIGKSPLVKHKKPAQKVTAELIPVKLTFEDTSTTFDPKQSSSCLASDSNADALTFASPIYKKHSYTVGGTKIGDVQYVDGFQREEFAKYTIGKKAKNPGYHVTLSATNEPEVSVSVPSSNGVTESGGCAGTYGNLDINWWDNYLETTLIPSLKSEISPTSFPVFLFYNVVMYDGSPGNCCIIGYHASYPNPAYGGAVQTYATADYIEPDLFPSSFLDIYAASHEVAEWMNDPYGNNPTPAWGHVGQVSGCQNNLEVGDPLTGTPPVDVTMPNGVTYHGQELAFRDWFYRTPSVGLHGWFSSRGTFKSNAGPLCT